MRIKIRKLAAKNKAIKIKKLIIKSYGEYPQIYLWDEARRLFPVFVREKEAVKTFDRDFCSF